MILFMVMVGLATIWTGPTFDDMRARRRARREFPGARVTFVLPSGMRGPQD